MRNSSITATSPANVQWSMCLLVLFLAFAEGCRSPLTKDGPNGGSTLSVFVRPDSSYRPGESGFKSTRLQPNFANAKRASQGTATTNGNSASLSDGGEEDYDVENNAQLKNWQKQLFRQQQLAVKNMLTNVDDVADPDQIRSERAKSALKSPKREAFAMQFSDNGETSEVTAAGEVEQESLVVVEKLNEPAPTTSSRNKSANETKPEKEELDAEKEAQHAYSKKLPKSKESKQEAIQTASATEKVDADSSNSNDSNVVVASLETSSSNVAAKSQEQSKQDATDWQVHARRAIAALETEQQKSQFTPELKQSVEGALRLMNLAIGDLDSALKPIEKMPSEEQQYVRNTLQALHHTFDPEGNPLASRRFALVLDSNRKAQTSAATVANLEVRNVAFCTEVDRFGMITKFPQYQFQAKQECLLYCEVDNFVAVPVKGGFETELQGSYEIVDSSGRRVADELLPLDKDFCTNHRRDYFIPYRIYMPNDIQPGKYQLKLTIEDMKGRKFGQSIVDFRIGS